MPMTMPMLSGPGAIAVTLGLSAQAGRTPSVRTLLNFLALDAILQLGLFMLASFESATDLVGRDGYQSL